MSDIGLRMLKLAEEWLDDNPPLSDLDFSTDSGFLHKAEEAYLYALRSREPNQLPEHGWVVYQLIGRGDRVIYVGMSGQPRRRVKQHSYEFGDRIVRVDWQRYDNRVEAYDAEAVLISELQPPLNRAGV